MDEIEFTKTIHSLVNLEQIILKVSFFVDGYSNLIETWILEDAPNIVNLGALGTALAY